MNYVDSKLHFHKCWVVKSQFLLAIVLYLIMLLPASAGKMPYTESILTLTHDAKKILINHGLPIKHDRSNPWLAIAGNSLRFYQSDEIPQKEILEVIKLCIDFYEKNEKKEHIKIVVYKESRDTWRESLILGIGSFAKVKPFIKIIIGGKE